MNCHKCILRKAFYKQNVVLKMLFLFELKNKYTKPNEINLIMIE